MVVGKAPQINGKLKKKVSSSYHMDYKIFIEASYNNNIHTGEKVFFEGLRVLFFSGDSKKLWYTLVCYESLYISREQRTK